MAVQVYYNLTRKLWSVMARRRVIDHADSLALSGVTFKVSEASRQRVIRTKRKTVHAFVCGERIDAIPSDGFTRVSYNP